MMGGWKLLRRGLALLLLGRDMLLLFVGLLDFVGNA
jgi:hypothetical protein